MPTINLGKVVGPQGPKGDQGETGPQGPAGSSAAGVYTFNGRTGEVVPQKGDYTADMVGAATPEQVQDALAKKQDKLTGAAGQVVGFNENGEAVAQDAPEGGGITTPVPVSDGGTGATTAAGARTNLGAAPTASPVFTGSISLGRNTGTTVGSGSFAVGASVVASGSCSHAECSNTTASGGYSHAEGYGTTAGGNCSHTEGGYTKVSDGAYAGHAEGYHTTVKYNYGHAAGYYTIANWGQYVIGSCNVENTASANRLIIGKGGDENSRANALRVNDSGVYASGNYNSSGADYAELFEWLDGNPDAEDRAGLFVTLDGDRIRIASPDDDYILGIVSADPSVVGDVYDDQWAGMYLRDVFGRTIMEMQDFPAEYGPDGEEIIPSRRELAPKINPDYDHTIKYQPRTERPEWDAVGLLGKLVAVDDGTCQPNGWCTVGEGGTATASAQRTKYRVMARLDERHIRVMIL